MDIIFKNNKNTIEFILLTVCFIIYFSWYSSYLFSPDYQGTSVSTTEMGLSTFGFICGIWLSTFLHRTIFNDANESKNIWFIIFIGIIGIITMSFAIVANLYNIKGILNIGWVQYNQILFPLYGGLILISEESFRHFIHYLLSEKKYNHEFSWKKINNYDSSIDNDIINSDIDFDSSSNTPNPSSEIDE